MHKSNGQLVQRWEWRANAIADRLAKKGAPDNLAAVVVEERIATAKKAVMHHAAVLGTVTYTANHWPTTVIGRDGEPHVVHRRDVTAPPRRAHTETTKADLPPRTTSTPTPGAA